jgi:hypothetical protein
VDARLERTHHAGRGLVKHSGRDVIEQMTFELKVDVKINQCRVSVRCERPPVRQVLQRPIDCVHQHLSRSIQRYLARETFLEWAEPDDELGDDLSIVLAAEARTAAPGDERGIILHVRDDREKLLGGIMERRPFLVTWHVTHLPLSNSSALLGPTSTKATLLARIRQYGGGIPARGGVVPSERGLPSEAAVTFSLMLTWKPRHAGSSVWLADMIGRVAPGGTATQALGWT